MRSCAEPCGVSRPLTEREATRIASGNRTAMAAIKLILALHKRRILWILEHPVASRFFHTAQIQSLLRGSRVQSIVLDQCQFNTHWRKRTRLLGGNLDELDFKALERRCRGHNGFCSRGGRHWILEGHTSGGARWTSVAAGYPDKLAHQIAHVLLASARAKRYNSGAHPPLP